MNTFMRMKIPIIKNSMIRNTSLIIIVLFIVACGSNTKKVYWDSGKLQSEVQYKEGEMHGPAIWYYENGNIQQELIYNQGNIDGEMKRYYSNGNLESVSYYKNGLLNGQALTYNREGVLVAEENYVNDTLDGPVNKYYSDGKPQMTGSYKNGLFHGVWVYYDVYGNVVGSANYNEGTGLLKAWWPNGNIKREVNYKNNQKNGAEKSFDSEGKLIEVLYFENGVKITDMDK